MAISNCETPVHDFMARHESQVVFSPRFLQDFAIYNQGHFCGMIWIIANLRDTQCQRIICVMKHVELV